MICYAERVNTPQSEATDFLRNVLSDLFGGSPNIKNVLRRCAHAYQILGWSQQLAWLQNELNGYSAGMDLPWYRKSVRGLTAWHPTGGLYAILDSVVEDRHSTKKEPPQYGEMDVWVGIDWILSAAQSGYVESTGRKSSRYISYRHESIETEEMTVYDKQVFQTIITNIENQAFASASNAYTILTYGDALQEVWQAYRTKVEEYLVPIGFGKHLDTIRNGLNSQNPQDWRAAMWSCRDMFHDLATYLWQDKRDTYGYLPGKGNDCKLQVTKNDYVNRLGAYLHQKAIVGTTGTYLRAEMERIYQSIKTLNALDSKAHGEVTIFDVRSAAIGTYVILGEMATRTDMRPVTEYCNPQ
ncbi:MAG: hypothetical protein HY681_13665 [Chloroflexi bacterium]|nr:hypothetical protein [Chloroflexota bacterium]